MLRAGSSGAGSGLQVAGCPVLGMFGGGVSTDLDSHVETSGDLRGPSPSGGNGRSGLVQRRCGIGFGRVRIENLAKTNATAQLNQPRSGISP